MSIEHPSEEERRDVIQYRMERARETLEAARLMLDQGYGNTAVNRLYYACFCAAEALLASQGRSAKTHKGTRMLFNKHFVRTQQVSSEQAALYNDLFEERLAGDYDDFVRFNVEEIRPWLPRAEAFVEAVAALIASEQQ